MLRGRFPIRPMSQFPESGEEESSLPLKPSRTVTSVYLRDPNSPDPAKLQPFKAVRDRLLDLFRDQRYHTATEMEAALPDRTWIGALQSLLALNYAFDRVDNYLKIRFREENEPRQILLELISGLDLLTSSEDSKETSQEANEEDEGELDFGPDDHGARKTEAKEEIEGGMVISDPPEALTLDINESVCMTAAILAKKHSGKTYLGMVIAEEFMEAKEYSIPVVIIDPMGGCFGLRAMADGQPSPYKILALGGRHGEAPITAKDGLRAAKAVEAVRPHPVIVDVSDLAPVEQHEFVADFVDGLYASKNRSPIHLIIDEADEYAPQTLSKSSPHQKRCLDAIDRLVRRGRTKGIGVTMITQRCAVISKNVLSQVDSLWFLNMGEPRDLLAVETRLNQGVTESQKRECLNQIPRLQPGMAYFIHTGTSPKFRRFKVRRKKTFDSSKTPTLKGYVAPVLAKAPTEILNLALACLRVEDLSEKLEDGER